MKYKILFLAFVFTLYTGYSMDNTFVYIPGIKIGYASGKGGGFICGFELSVGMNFDNRNAKSFMFFSGIVTGIDYFKRKFKLNLGIEAQAWPIPGICIGPSLFFDSSKSFTGISCLVYEGLGLVHFGYNYNYYFNHNDNHELLAYFKFPCPLMINLLSHPMFE